VKFTKGALVASSATVALVLSACGGGGSGGTTDSGKKNATAFNGATKGVVNPSD
jgi:hypothetical protein